MDDFKNYLTMLTIVSLIVNTIKMLLPVGKMYNICSTVLGLVYTYILLMPIFTLLIEL